MRILVAARAVRAERGIVLDHIDETAYGPWLQELGQLGGEDGFERQHAAGAELTLDETVEQLST